MTSKLSKLLPMLEETASELLETHRQANLSSSSSSSSSSSPQRLTTTTKFLLFAMAALDLAEANQEQEEETKGHHINDSSSSSSSGGSGNEASLLQLRKGVRKQLQLSLSPSSPPSSPRPSSGDKKNFSSRTDTKETATASNVVAAEDPGVDGAEARATEALAERKHIDLGQYSHTRVFSGNTRKTEKFAKLMGGGHGDSGHGSSSTRTTTTTAATTGPGNKRERQGESAAAGTDSARRKRPIQREEDDSDDDDNTSNYSKEGQPEHASFAPSSEEAHRVTHNIEEQYSAAVSHRRGKGLGAR